MSSLIIDIDLGIDDDSPYNNSAGVFGGVSQSNAGSFVPIVFTLCTDGLVYSMRSTVECDSIEDAVKYYNESCGRDVFLAQLKLLKIIMKRKAFVRASLKPGSTITLCPLIEYEMYVCEIDVPVTLFSRVIDRARDLAGEGEDS